MTYAIFRAAGFQYRAEPGDILRLPASLDAKAGDVLTFKEVLLGSADGKVVVGRPTVKGAAVKAEVLRHGKGDKVIVFKFKRRKNYRKKTGHRQDYTEIQVQKIDLGGGKKTKAAPAEAKEKRAKKTTAKASSAAPAAKKKSPKTKKKDS